MDASNATSPRLFGPTSPMPFDASADASSMWTCSLRVGAECDGDEDCTTGQVCCGELNMATFTYTSIGCRDSCPADMAHYKLCHPGETCPAADEVCRRSQLLPFEFISVCAAAAMVPVEATGESVAGEIGCGAMTCGSGQKCCLRSLLNVAMRAREVQEPQCVAFDAECDCEDPAMSGEDGGLDDGGA